MYSLDRIVEYLETAETLFKRQDAKAASWRVEWALSAARNLQTVLAGVDAGISTDTVTESAGQPHWSLDIPPTVALICPHCKQAVDCEVEIADPDRSASATAEIEHDGFCENCNKPLCPKCPRFPHPDDGDLLRCLTCAQAETQMVEEHLKAAGWRRKVNYGGQTEFYSPDNDYQVAMAKDYGWTLGRFTDSDIDGVAVGRYALHAEGETLEALQECLAEVQNARR